MATPTLGRRQLDNLIVKHENLKNDFAAYRTHTKKHFETLKQSLDELRDTTDKKTRYLNHELGRSQIREQLLKDRIIALELIAGLESSMDGDDGLEGCDGSSPTEQSGQDGSSNTDGNEVNLVPGEGDTVAGDGVVINDRCDHANTKSMKLLVNDMFVHLMGVDTIKPTELPGYPRGITATDDAWPKASTNEPLLRFDWDHTAGVEPNKSAISHIAKDIGVNGAHRVPAAGVDIQACTPEQISQRVTKKFNYIRNERQRALATQAREDERDIDDQITGTSLTMALKNSRAQSLLEQRLRKRDALPLDSPYRHAKFDSAFILNAMEALEDDNARPKEQGKGYIKRRYDWWSDELVTIFSTIDAVPDPNPDRAKVMTARREGPPIEGVAPAAAKSLLTRVRQWMVRDEILSKPENAHWHGRRVAANGKDWGDVEDPVDEKPFKKRKTTSLELEGIQKKRKQAKGKMHIALQKHDTQFPENIDPALLFSKPN
ncbi:hypothetical protein FISHEDRAFT_73100 [Fistulina hepatica ATCC 64428]|uniref:Uncharacterized protein n=1 Tax=Fistulina hepatica ATCC 64428 TaxID=1128425 RepID=A0A0D7AGG4_9AGAR|nr:hypothetical protein FISHEDRAFT_73100 [Fistulina hepatica ATCC 64428]